MNDFLYQYRLPVIGSILGFTIALLFLTIGFLKTLLLVILTLVGGAIGFYLKKSGIWESLFPRK